MTPTSTRVSYVVWQSPAGRLHLHQRCSSNGRSRDTKKITVSREQYEATKQDGKVCRCLQWAAAPTA